MITSALISQLRREYRDIPKSTRMLRAGDGSTTLFNVGRFPIMENSYSIYKATSAQTETTNYTLDLDNGDLQFIVAPGSAIQTKAEFKYSFWRDKNWVEAINQSIESLNARGFFRQIVRNTSVFRISANIRTYSAPSATIDAYELLLFSDRTVSGSYTRVPGNWSYQQDANKILLGYNPSTAERAALSYLRNLQTYSATSATLDVLTDWLELLKKKAGAIYYRSLAGKIASQGAATIDEGHFSFTNLRTMANDLDTEFERLAARKKPTRPSKDMQFLVAGTGPG